MPELRLFSKMVRAFAFGGCRLILFDRSMLHPIRISHPKLVRSPAAEERAGGEGDGEEEQVGPQG